MIAVGSGGRVWGVRLDVNEELKFLIKFTTKNWGGGGWGVRVGGCLGWGQGGCERRIEVFVNTQKKKWGGGLGRGVELGVRVNVNEELKFLRKFTKKIRGGGGGREGGQVGVGL